MKRFRSVFCLLLLVSASSCGGDGGDDMPYFAGVWSGVLNLVEDSCGRAATDYVFFNHLVNQNELQVVVDNGVTAFTGSVQSDNSFSASATRPVPPLEGAGQCTETITWRYEAIDEFRDTAQFVVRLSEIVCVEDDAISECRSAFSGSGYRWSNDRVFPLESPPGEAGDAVAAGEMNEAQL